MDLARFDNSAFDRGAGSVKETMWVVMRAIFFHHFPVPAYSLRRAILKSFGAAVGAGVAIKPGVTITFPWKLSIGENSWLGEAAWLLNLAPITIGKNVCISQRAFLCTGNHDWSDPAFQLEVKPITIGDGAWICAQAFVCPGISVGANAVVTAGSVVTHDLPSDMICSGNPCEPIKPRHIRAENSADR